MTWDDNSAGELGNGTLTPSTKPVAVGGSGGITAISSGGRHVLGLTSGGTVLAWGNDTAGQLGNGAASASDDAENPVTVNGLTGVTQVSAGAEHSLALLSNGTVMTWGDGENAQLGDGKAGSDVPVAVKGLTGVTAVAAGSRSTVAVARVLGMMVSKPRGKVAVEGWLRRGNVSDNRVSPAACSAVDEGPDHKEHSAERGIPAEGGQLRNVLCGRSGKEDASDR
jgi:regulator of chromosome condensation (RCC1) repeat-containing protein